MCLHRVSSFFYGIYGCAVLLQVQVSILVAKLFRVYYIINVPSKYVLIVISGYSTTIRSQNMGCSLSVTK